MREYYKNRAEIFFSLAALNNFFDELKDGEIVKVYSNGPQYFFVWYRIKEYE
jgi:hypothetical protein